jgi:hypothetical protein
VNQHLPGVPKLFFCDFTVDQTTPFRRYLNRLEVEIGREDYGQMKRVELVTEGIGDDAFAAMEELTPRILATTQNNYNRDQLRRLGVRVYLDVARYTVYYRLANKTVRFVASWRQRVLRSFFRGVPVADTGWQGVGHRLPGFSARFLPDGAGGVLLLAGSDERRRLETLLTATHGPYDPHTLEVALYFLRTGRGGAAMINLGFSGREPLSDANLEKLKDWGIPLNPSNIDVIYPYADASGHPHCYKLEEGLQRYVTLLGGGPPQVIIDIHGCVGTRPDDCRLIVGLGGISPYPRTADLGRLEAVNGGITLTPKPMLLGSLALLRDLSPESCLQFCTSRHRCYHFRLGDGPPFPGRSVDPRTEACSLLTGEPRYYLPAEQARWLPGAGGNALQRREAAKLRPDALCLHVEIPTAVRRRIAVRLRELEIGDSLDASGL